jgi:hypothetical protein
LLLSLCTTRRWRHGSKLVDAATLLLPHACIGPSAPSNEAWMAYTNALLACMHYPMIMGHVVTLQLYNATDHLSTWYGSPICALGQWCCDPRCLLRASSGCMLTKSNPANVAAVINTDTRRTPISRSNADVFLLFRCDLAWTTANNLSGNPVHIVC